MNSKKILLLLFTWLFFVSINTFAQTNPSTPKKAIQKRETKAEKQINHNEDNPTMIDKPIVYTEPDSNTIYTMVDVKPSYQGGMNAFLAYIQENFKTPETFEEDQRVFVQFVVEKNGSLSNIKMVKDVKFDVKELLKTIEKSPRWKPGTNKDEPVRVLYSLPILIKAVKK